MPGEGIAVLVGIEEGKGFLWTALAGPHARHELAHDRVSAVAQPPSRLLDPPTR